MIAHGRTQKNVVVSKTRVESVMFGLMNPSIGKRKIKEKLLNIGKLNEV